MNFEIPPDLQSYLNRLDEFIEKEITPLQNSNDNNRFFDHRREHSRTDWDNGGLPRKEWEDLLRECKIRADKAGFYRFSLPKQFGGQNEDSGRGANLWMAVIREHLASKGLGLFNDLQNEHSIVGNFPTVIMVQHFGTEQQKQHFIPAILEGKERITFGLTEPWHGSDATHMDTKAEKQSDGSWVINGGKMWQTGMHSATNSFLFARSSGKNGDAKGITCFIVPTDAPGFTVESFQWTLNMPTDHATVSFKDVKVPGSAILGKEGEGLAVAQAFVHENRIRQAASSLGAAIYCINQSVNYARQRSPFGKPLATNQAIQFPLVELATQCEMLRQLIRKTALEMDKMPHVEVESKLGDKISMCNYWGNRLCTDAADRAIQVHGGWGYSRHCQFEHIWRHHRRYRITEGSEEIQGGNIRNVPLMIYTNSLVDEKSWRLSVWLLGSEEGRHVEAINACLYTVGYPYCVVPVLFQFIRARPFCDDGRSGLGHSCHHGGTVGRLDIKRRATSRWYSVRFFHRRFRAAEWRKGVITSHAPTLFLSFLRNYRVSRIPECLQAFVVDRMPFKQS
jgi:alkylation response protein AidB-like acyl-CoA dehydrogenase